MPGIASAATSVVIGYVAGGTKTIRVGSGGIMLPNHSPLVIAEQFGTLASLYPDRIDLGLGRAPGTDHAHHARTSPRHAATADNFPQDVEELQSYFEPASTQSKSSRRSRRGPARADLAARFEPLQRAACGKARPALRVRIALRARRHDAGARTLSRPLPAIAPARPSLRHARRECHRRGNRRRSAVPLHVRSSNRSPIFAAALPGQIPPPIHDIDSFWSPAEKASASMTLLCSVVGSPETAQRRLLNFLELTQPDEIITTAHMYDHSARLRSFELLAGIRARHGGVR